MMRSSPAAVLAEKYNLPDGVEPEDQLSFVKAVKAHENTATKLDDVSSREALNSYFDKMGAEYKQSAEEQRKVREVRHPGQLRSHSVVDTFVRQIKALGETKSKADRVKEDLSKEAANVQAAVSEGLKDSHDSSDPKGALSIKVPGLNKVLGKAVEQVKAAVDTKPAVAAPQPAAAAPVTQLAGAKVKVEFYMESMCPGCKYFTTNVLSDLLAKPGFTSIVDLKVYPYGNGKLTGSTIQCQHGSEECEGNKIIACMQSLYPVTSASTGFMPAFTCLEKAKGVPAEDAETCAAANGLDYAKVKACAASAEGDQLALEAARATEALNPPHEYAPWLTLNGQPLRDRAYDLKDEVCAAYSGDKKGTMCETAAAKAPLQALAARGHMSVCYPTANNIVAAPRKAVAAPRKAAAAPQRKVAVGPPHLRRAPPTVATAVAAAAAAAVRRSAAAHKPLAAPYRAHAATAAHLQHRAAVGKAGAAVPAAPRHAAQAHRVPPRPHPAAARHARAPRK